MADDRKPAAGKTPPGDDAPGGGGPGGGRPGGGIPGGGGPGGVSPGGSAGSDVTLDAGVDMPDEVDPKVAELVMTIRDRFGLRGLRGARWMIDNEIRLAEEALAALAPDS